MMTKTSEAVDDGDRLKLIDAFCEFNPIPQRTYIKCNAIKDFPSSDSSKKVCGNLLFLYCAYHNFLIPSISAALVNQWLQTF